MFNNRGGRGRGRGRGKNNNNDDNKNNKEDVQFLVDYLPQNVIRKQRTTTPKKNLGLGQERAFDGITELERIYFIDVEDADDLPENFELLLGPIPNSVGLYTEPIDVACHRFDKERRANDASKRSSTSRKKYDGVISAPKVMEVISNSNSNSKMATKVSNHSSMGSSHFQNNGTGTSSGERIQESNSNSNDTNPWVLFDIPEPIPYNLSQIRIEKSLFSAGMINQSRVVNFFADLDSDSDNE